MRYYFTVFGLFIGLISVIFNANAQQNTVASGGEGSGTGGSFSYSIGQIDYIEATGNNGSSNQGLQQPLEIYTLGSKELKNDILKITAYPNPTQFSLKVEMQNINSANTYYTLHDINGILIKKDIIAERYTNISMENYAIGQYILIIHEGRNPIKKFKIIKN